MRGDTGRGPGHARSVCSWIRLKFRFGIVTIIILIVNYHHPHICSLLSSAHALSLSLDSLVSLSLSLHNRAG